MQPDVATEKSRLQMTSEIVKRDGRIVAFDRNKITTAMRKCFAGLQTSPVEATLEDYTDRVVNVVAIRYERPTVEQVQDEVERTLQAAGEYEAAKQYILYRAKRTEIRQQRPIPETVRQAFDESAAYFPTPIQQFQFYDKYSRFNYELGRRETWIETVDRSVDFLHELAGDRLDRQVYERIRQSILEMKALPSMRLLAMAGAAARRSNITIYNCSYLPVDDPLSWVEALTISMAGCGVGYSVESRYVDKLPAVREQRKRPEGAVPTYIVNDSAEGWSDALEKGLRYWFDGDDIRFNLDTVRPSGAPLRTKGGRSSGPEPLRVMLDFVRSRILARQGKRLRPIDAHDIMCAVGSAAVSGGMRRTAMLSLFDIDDIEMRQAKSGDFERDNNQRWNANNSAVWPEEGVDQVTYLEQMLEMFKGGRGEPGIFSREAAIRSKPARRQPNDFGCNPCGEIVLRPYQFCNLSIAVAREDDTFETLFDKVEVATIIGTIQSLATNFPGLRDVWRLNCQEERLLGVDINGQMDSPAAQDRFNQGLLADTVRQVNAHYAAQLGINKSAATTCVKPSGNSSQLLDCSSGVHTRWAPYYIRNVRVSAHGPVFKVLAAAGVPMDPENGQTKDNATTWVVHFPMRSPVNAVTRKDRTAIDQCNYWLQVKQWWTEHNASVTVTYQQHEVMDLVAWIWEHRQEIGGMTFLPASDAQYAQMPYVEITEDEYNKLVDKFPAIDFAKLYYYEDSDLTTAAQELACMAGVCEVELPLQ